MLLRTVSRTTIPDTPVQYNTVHSKLPIVPPRQQID